MPPIVGFLAAGALVGPNSFGLVAHVELVENLAEVGVVVLLFTVGMELSLPKLLRMRSAVFVTGGIQVLATTGLGTVVALASGAPLGQAVFLGFLLTLSSTAAVTKLLSDRGEFASPAGRVGLSVCVAQDLAVVPMILVIPLLGGVDQDPSEAVMGVLRAFGILALIAVAAMVLIPPILGAVARSRSRELFVLTVITLCLAVSVSTAYLGLSLALGAFLAGLVVAGSDYHHQAVSEIEPFRDALSSLFFVSIGMLFDVQVILDHPVMVALALGAVVIGKVFVTFFAVKALRLPTWVALRSGLMIAQVGEFSFVLAQVAGEGLLPPDLQKIFLVVAVLSIAMTPLLFAGGKWLARRSQATAKERSHDQGGIRDHVIIVGFGPVGQHLASSLKSLGIPYRIVEMNANTVKAYKAKGEPIFLGDATRTVVLQAAGVIRARLLVIAVADPGATSRAAVLARHLVPNLHIIARAVFLSDVPTLQSIKVSEIVPQELETSVEIAARALRKYLIPSDEIGRQVRRIRKEAFGIDKVSPKPDVTSANVSDFVPGLGVQIFRVEAHSDIAGKTLAKSKLRARTGMSLIAVKRNDTTKLDLGPDTVLEVDDIVVALGPNDRVGDVALLFAGPGLAAVMSEAESESAGVDLTSPELASPELASPELANPELANPELANPEPEDLMVEDPETVE